MRDCDCCFVDPVREVTIERLDYAAKQLVWDLEVRWGPKHERAGQYLTTEELAGLIWVYL